MGASSSTQNEKNQIYTNSLEVKKEIENKNNKKKYLKVIIYLITLKKMKLNRSMKKKKKEEEIKKGAEKEKYKIKPLYRKAQINLINKEKSFTNYIVLYIPKNYEQLQTINY